MKEFHIGNLSGNVLVDEGDEANKNCNMKCETNRNQTYMSILSPRGEQERAASITWMPKVFYCRVSCIIRSFMSNYLSISK
jgi:hypothetical protein